MKEEISNKATDVVTDATVGAMSLLDEMKQAGLIDEKEYQQRKKELEKNKASPGGSCRA